MQRFAALTARAALLTALLSLAPLAHAQGNVYNLYLVPITPLDKAVAPGSTVQFAAMLDIPAGADPLTLTIGAAVGYDKTIFDINSITAAADTSAFAPKPAVKLWDLNPPTIKSATTDGIATLQLGVGHSRQSLTVGGAILTVPPGTYTIGTYSFPILSGAALQPTTIILPGAAGKTGPSASLDFLGAIDSAGTDRSTFAFPNASGKFSSLTYTVGFANTTLVTFNVVFQGLATNGPAQPITVTFHPTDNSGDITKTGTASQTAAFVARVPFNTYDIFIKSPKYLGVALRGTVLGTAAQSETVTLLAGDANNDNIVDMADFGIMVNAYGSRLNDGSGRYNANADFNSDNSVDIGDFNLLVESYSLTGY